MGSDLPMQLKSILTYLFLLYLLPGTHVESKPVLTSAQQTSLYDYRSRQMLRYQREMQKIELIFRSKSWLSSSQSMLRCDKEWEAQVISLTSTSEYTILRASATLFLFT
jgi:hypothetical protein